MQLHRRDKHPIGILKNAIYDYFDSNYDKQFDKFEDLSPIVTTKQVKSFPTFQDCIFPFFLSPISVE